jgi:hypothetical protein
VKSLSLNLSINTINKINYSIKFFSLFFFLSDFFDNLKYD